MTDPLEIDRAEVDETKRAGFWGKLKQGLGMTRGRLAERISAAVSGRGVMDEETLEELEESLIAADLGVETSLELIDNIRDRVLSGQAGDIVKLREMLVDEASILLLDAPRWRPPKSPSVILVVGVNGCGKTTSIAKLGKRAQDAGHKVLFAAADTFRAAAIEQLCIWGERLEIDVVRQKPGSDPAAVVFDALRAAAARSADQVIVDTAGRLHTKSNLMEELAKIGRVIDREASAEGVGGWQRRVLLVLDGTTGQNAVIQAREFSQTVPVDGIVLTKLDGTAKGGVVVAVARELRLPVVYLGVGEQADDLVDFHPRDFAAALFA